VTRDRCSLPQSKGLASLAQKLGRDLRANTPRIMMMSRYDARRPLIPQNEAPPRTGNPDGASQELAKRDNGSGVAPGAWIGWSKMRAKVLPDRNQRAGVADPRSAHLYCLF
jgi:hypothetical protein